MLLPGDGIESEPYRLYNLDVFEYLHDSPFGLYGSIPFMLGHRPGLTIGAFWCALAYESHVTGVGSTGRPKDWTLSKLSTGLAITTIEICS